DIGAGHDRRGRRRAVMHGRIGGLAEAIAVLRQRSGGNERRAQRERRKDSFGSDHRFAPLALAFLISSSCWPRTGAARRTPPGVADILSGTPSVFCLPALACSTSATMPRARICGSAKTS